MIAPDKTAKMHCCPERILVILNQLFGVMAGLVPAIPIVAHCALLIEIAETSPAMTLLNELMHFRSRHA